MPKNGDIIEFYRKKQFEYVKPLGAGGTGDTHLFRDNTTNMLFAIKKYSPKDKQYIDEFYTRFVDEIKILFNLSHQNIVRVYNYYLYPEFKLGYLQMEYVEGTTIDEYEPDGWGKDWETIFSETINAFKYLEENKILHRDIRPANILIDKEETVKIIDFGFGKILSDTNDGGESIFLNWPVTEFPEEVAIQKVYNNQSEIYFVGKLFYHLLKDNLSSFRYTYILDKMIKVSPTDRFKSFEEITHTISTGVISEIDFTSTQKKTYLNLAKAISQSLDNYTSNFFPIDNVTDVLNSLATVIRNSALETVVQDNGPIIEAFISNGFRYSNSVDIEVSSVTDFYQLMIQLPPTKQKIVLNNLHARIANKDVVGYDEELPF